MDKKAFVESGRTALGIEFGSTRIKAVLAGEDGTPLSSGSYTWENQYVDGVWSYSLEEIRKGLQSCYADMAAAVKETYGITLTKIGSLGFSAMMHGYMAFDKEGRLLAPFRTWRNTMTAEAAGKLTEAFAYHIPQRWSIAHLYQAILKKEEHVKDIAYLTTLAGYIHWQLTGEKVLGVGDASGMFPIDPATKQYDADRMKKFDEMIAPFGFDWSLQDILPKVLVAGEEAGRLTERGAGLLDTGGNLKAGIPVCPPEGDAGTGMTATNSVAKRTGNVSAGTSVFAMVVLEKEPEKVHEEIDLVTTPAGDPVAMVHCNNCTSEINAWAEIFARFAEYAGMKTEKDAVFEIMFQKALEGEADCGGLMGFNYVSGEPVTGFQEGRPMLLRTPDARFTFENFMRLQLYTALGALKYGMDILFQTEEVKVDKMFAHGGFFKTEPVGQKIMAAAMDAPVTVMETAGEGGAWGIAVLALYAKQKQPGESLESYLENKIFAGGQGRAVEPDKADAEGFRAFMERYVKTFPVEHAAAKYLQ